MALYQKQGPVFSLDSKSILVYKLCEKALMVSCRNMGHVGPNHENSRHQSLNPSAKQQNGTPLLNPRCVAQNKDPNGLSAIPQDTAITSTAQKRYTEAFALPRDVVTIEDWLPFPFSVMMLQCIHSAVAHRRWNWHSSCAI